MQVSMSSSTLTSSSCSSSGRHAAAACHQHTSLAAAWRARQTHQRRRHAATAAAAAAATSGVELVATMGQLATWVAGQGAPVTGRLEPKRFLADAAGCERVGLIASADAAAGDVLLELPDSLVVTSVDAEKHEVIGAVARECSELVALTLWLMAERGAGAASRWAPLLQALPAATASPILWEDQVRAQLLAGSPVLAEARSRQAALQEQWAALAAGHFDAQPGTFPPAVFNEASFLSAFCVVLACAAYLPAAECFALVPLAAGMGRTGNDNGASLDYDPASSSVRLTATRPYREGQEVLINDGRPNGEMLLSTGLMQDANTSDCIMFKAALVPADRYYAMKAQVLESFGFGPETAFPVFADRFPIQLLAYLRLSRIQDPGLFAKVDFEGDVVISQMNEYEVLQLLMGDCREALAAYPTSLEEDTKRLQQPGLSARERLATRLTLGEKTILSQTMDAVRRRLAPIRGIPTKAGGMADPNADIKEVFDLIEGLPSAPAKMFDGLRRWARGEFDPDWDKK